MKNKLYFTAASMLLVAFTASAANSTLLQALIDYQQYKAATEGQVLGVTDFNTSTTLGCNFNSVCEPDLYENQFTCPSDCIPAPPSPPATGCNYNGICESSRGETTDNCAADCPPPPPSLPVLACNYNGICESSRGENLQNCYQDCYVAPTLPTPPTSTPPAPVCNYNGICEPTRGETLSNCYSDCYVPSKATSTPPAPICNYNKICEPSRGETLANCYSDCYVAPAPACNYNKICESARGENSTNCLYDCPIAKPTSTNPCNYNKVCEPIKGENYLNCLYDCPKPGTSVGLPIKPMSDPQSNSEDNQTLNSFFDIYTEMTFSYRSKAGLSGLQKSFIIAVDKIVASYSQLPANDGNSVNFVKELKLTYDDYKKRGGGNAQLNSFFDIFTEMTYSAGKKSGWVRNFTTNSFFDIFLEATLMSGGKGPATGGGRRSATSTPPGGNPPREPRTGRELGEKTDSTDIGNSTDNQVMAKKKPVSDPSSFFDVFMSAGRGGVSGENKTNSFFDIFTELNSKKKPISGPSSFFDVYLEMADKKGSGGENKTNSFFDIFTEIDTASAKKGPNCSKEVNDNVNQARFEAFNTYTKMVNEALIERWTAERSAYNLSNITERENAIEQAQKDYRAAEYSAKSSLDTANSFINLQEAKLENYCK